MTAANIQFPSLKSYLWTEDATTSKMLIEPSFKVDLKSVQQRPAILVKRGPVGMGYPGLGDGRHQPHLQGSGPMEGYLTGIEYTTFVSGAHDLLCVGMNGAEAELLGWETFLKYATFKEVLKREAKLGKFIVSGLSPVQKLDENQENWVTVVSVAWKHTLEWTLNQDAPVLKKIMSDSSI